MSCAGACELPLRQESVRHLKAERIAKQLLLFNRPKAAPAAADDDNDEFDLEYSRQIAARRVIGEEDGEA